MAEIAKKITIDRKQMKLFIDGVEFPWIITEDGPEVAHVAARNDLAVVTVPIFAADVEVVPAND